jgi:hypothetical protein
MSKFKNALRGAFTALFVLAIVIFLAGRLLCVRDNADYTAKQPEFFGPEEILTALYDAELGQIYVCYNDASYVNVYSEEGEFLWAVSTPYLRNAYFELSENRLIVYNSYDAYVYNSENGAFIEKINSEDYELDYGWENEHTDDFENGKFYFDTYGVYKAEDGALRAIVSRPFWHWIFNPGVCFSITLCSAFGLGILLFIEQSAEYRKIKPSKQSANVSNRKAKFLLKYFKASSAVHIIYAALNVILAIFEIYVLCPVIMLLGIHFIVSNIVLVNVAGHAKLTGNEKKIFDYWAICGLASFIIAFFSVFASVIIAP